MFLLQYDYITQLWHHYDVAGHCIVLCCIALSGLNKDNKTGRLGFLVQAAHNDQSKQPRQYIKLLVFIKVMTMLRGTIIPPKTDYGFEG